MFLGFSFWQYISIFFEETAAIPKANSITLDWEEVASKKQIEETHQKKQTTQFLRGLGLASVPNEWV